MLRSFSSFVRGKPGVRTVAGLGVLAVVMALALGLTTQGIAAAGEVPVTGKWGGPIDPDALQILKGMTDYLGSLQRFSMYTENSYEDVLATGQKIQFSFSSSIVAQRPDKLRVKRWDGQSKRLFIYDGETLSFPPLQWRVVEQEPEHVALRFGREALGLRRFVGPLLLL